LAYALQRALHEPAAVRAVRVPQTTHPARFHSPIPVGTLEGDDPAALTKLSSRSDLMVVQRPSGSGDPAVARIMAELERDTQCLLVEVDDEGDINRVSGPDGWFYAAADHPRGLGSGDRVTTGTARQPVSGRH
jgi:hypothetical protein